MKRLFFTSIFMFFFVIGFSQDKIEVTEQDYVNADVEMADKFRAEGKIYVLTGIILIILFGTILYLVAIDRKVAKLEKQLKNH
ncbi:MAG: CcmD family protein [Bacteroidota bacterium]